MFAYLHIHFDALKHYTEVRTTLFLSNFDKGYNFKVNVAFSAFIFFSSWHVISRITLLYNLEIRKTVIVIPRCGLILSVGPEIALLCSNTRCLPLNTFLVIDFALVQSRADIIDLQKHTLLIFKWYYFGIVSDNYRIITFLRPSLPLDTIKWSDIAFSASQCHECNNFLVKTIWMLSHKNRTTLKGDLWICFRR